MWTRWCGGVNTSPGGDYLPGAVVVDAECRHLGLYNHQLPFALLLEKLRVTYVAQILGAHEELTIWFDAPSSSQHCVFFHVTVLLLILFRTSPTL